MCNDAFYCKIVFCSINRKNQLSEPPLVLLIRIIGVLLYLQRQEPNCFFGVATTSIVSRNLSSTEYSDSKQI